MNIPASRCGALFVTFCFLVLSHNNNALTPWIFNDGDYVVTLSGKLRPESFFGKNVSLLNNCNRFDRLLWSRHTFDSGVEMLYGGKTYGQGVASFKAQWRNKARWGDPFSIASTTQTETRSLDEVGREHKHAFPRLISWMREIWFECDMARAFGLSFPTEPTLKLGAFPFSLGRGIALGAAYAVGPEFLGFYSDAAIDQYAFGAKISDTFVPDILDFDFYLAMLQNRAGSLSQTGAVILAQQFGRQDCPERGPYKINFAAATRCKWTAINSKKYGKFELEPYILFNHDPEQRVEFTADAESKLVTLGFAGEYTRNKWEFGFDSAFNFGRQRVKGWDRNRNQLENRNGRPVLVNSHVFVNIDPENSAQTSLNSTSNFKAINAKNTVSGNGTVNGEDVNFDYCVQPYGKEAQDLINCVVQDAESNGMKIGTVDGYTDAVGAPVPKEQDGEHLIPDNSNKDMFFSATNRFRNEYKNKYAGWMVVGDVAYWIKENELRLAATAGITSGDRNPNETNMDGKYSGFIPLQEIYFGVRVPSVFLLGSGGQLSRPLSQPRNNLEAPSRFASAVNGFTNLILGGGGLLWKPADSARKMSLNPNIIAFWQDDPGVKFNAATGKDTSETASRYLGLEFNVFFDYMMFKNTKFFIVSSVFVPGQHFSDIKGRPINAAQEARLNRFNRTSLTGEPIPNIGDNVAFTLNIGMEFKF